MKKFFKIGCLGFISLIVLGVVISMFSSDDDTTTTSGDGGSGDTGSAEEEKVKTVGIGEEVAVGKLAFTVNSSEEQQELSNSFDSMTTDGKFVIVDVTVGNNDSEARIVDGEMFRLIGSDGTEFSSNTEADMYINDDVGFFLQEINPKMNKTGKIAFEVPAEEEGYTLQVSSGLGWSGGEYKAIELTE
ncbi:DUF4352 domain-containing protein [Halobacillus karajensis]|uniref:DUF4352 domain-containing protein n=1 Tax=Halobacillus karajensis TaxID=195088 RepID=UPI00045CCA18|nr:DUF4352 domain-containing protein [Halobacillus karajensis]CDQ21686.1 Telomeric repeat-binding factor 2 [Halobacillus karajensis]